MSIDSISFTFNTIELLETILSNTDASNLTKHRGVYQQWKVVIDTSLSLRRRRFLEPLSCSQVLERRRVPRSVGRGWLHRLLPFVSDKQTTSTVQASPIGRLHPLLNSHNYTTEREAIWAFIGRGPRRAEKIQKLVGDEEGIWNEMYITQPPAQSARLRIRFADARDMDYRSKHVWNETFCETGLTFGVVFQQIRQTLRDRRHTQHRVDLVVSEISIFVEGLVAEGSQYVRAGERHSRLIEEAEEDRAAHLVWFGDGGYEQTRSIPAEHGSAVCDVGVSDILREADHLLGWLQSWSMYTSRPDWLAPNPD